MMAADKWLNKTAVVGDVKYHHDKHDNSPPYYLPLQPRVFTYKLL